MVDAKAAFKEHLAPAWPPHQRGFPPAMTRCRCAQAGDLLSLLMCYPDT